MKQGVVVAVVVVVVVDVVPQRAMVLWVTLVVGEWWYPWDDVDGDGDGGAGGPGPTKNVARSLGQDCAAAVAVVAVEGTVCLDLGIQLLGFWRLHQC